MIESIQIRCTPEQAKDDRYLKQLIKSELNLSEQQFDYKWHRRSIDARKKQIMISGIIEVFINESIPDKEIIYEVNDVSDANSIVIIGSGPAGLFAAMEAIRLGFKPIIFERGKDVRARRRDLAKINKESVVNSESNYCFGEGGAGTYSDGKLYTRSKKKGDIMRALRAFVQFGADQDIIIDAHPHIGTNKLPQIIVAMREYIIECGGEVHFESKLTDILVDNEKLVAIQINNQTPFSVENVILATGHSARDIFYLLKNKNLSLEAKSFALGVRVEHSQELIDKIQYHGRLNDELLPPASYSLVEQVDGKGVYSFCMCPGGIIAPCATADGEVVTNGWSPSKRNNPFSNSGIVVTVEPTDFEGEDPMRCLEFQKSVEHACWLAAGQTQKVPAQRMIDFIEGRVSKDLPKTSYQPGLVSVDLNKILPQFITDRLKKAFVVFGKKMHGYMTNDAVLHATESRTSSPIKIPRTEKLEHPDADGLYPCGEGAGYAGGIISAAIDGMRCVQAINAKVNG